MVNYTAYPGEFLFSRGLLNACGNPPKHSACQRRRGQKPPLENFATIHKENFKFSHIFGCSILRACLKPKKFNKAAPLRGVMPLFNARKNEESDQKVCTKKYTF